MFRKLLLAAAIALPLATLVGHGALSGDIAHAAGVGAPIPATFGCGGTTYTYTPSGPYTLDYCVLGESDGADGMAPDTDDNSGFQNEVGTVSYVGLGCIAASITTGHGFYNPTGWVEFDAYNQMTDMVSVRSQCTVQTGDATGANGPSAVPAQNLFANAYGSTCDLQLYGDSAVYSPPSMGPYSAQVFETESTNGVVTLHCNANIPMSMLCAVVPVLTPMSLRAGTVSRRDGSV